jgi:hypothetical protein
MPTLRQKVDHFCKDSGAKVDASDKLRGQVAALKTTLRKTKESHKKELKALTKKAKAVPKVPKAPKAPKVKQVVKMNPLPAQAEPMMPAPAPSLAPAAPRGGRTRRTVRR